MANLVRFGLSNVHYAVSNGDGTYGTPIAFKGAVSLTTSAEDDSSTFYADNIAYYVTNSNNGYTGSLEMAAIEDDFLTTVLANSYDETSGLTYEVTTAEPVAVALMFEVSGNIEQQRCVMYNVTFSRVSTDANTKAESTDPDTATLDFTAIGQTFTVDGSEVNVSKAVVSSTDTVGAYEAFYDHVQIPGQSPTA